jgi:hypothetical protein
MAAADITLKVGDTLLADCTYRDPNGASVNLDTAGITIKSSACFERGGSVTHDPLEVTLYDQSTRPGEYRIRGETSDWPAGQHVLWDVRYFKGQDSFSSRTLAIQMLPQIS